MQTDGTMECLNTDLSQNDFRYFLWLHGRPYQCLRDHNGALEEQIRIVFARITISHSFIISKTFTGGDKTLSRRPLSQIGHYPECVLFLLGIEKYVFVGLGDQLVRLYWTASGGFLRQYNIT